MKKLKNFTREELEVLSYTDIALMYLKEMKKTMNTADLFKKVCELLEMSEDEYTDKIADFFQSLTTSKEFILLDNGEWDLKSNHSIKMVIEDLDEDMNSEEEDADDEIDETEEEDEDIDSIDDYEDITEDEDLSDLTIVSEEELEDE